MQPHFLGRLPELSLLDRLWDQASAQFLVLYGRRRVGKTRLLSHWVKSRLPRAIFWIADQDSKEAHLRQFSQAVYNFANPDLPAPESFTYASWEQAWAQVAALAVDQRLAVVVDEFTYLLESDPSIAGKLQRAWDQTLENANLLLALSGSHMGMMQRGVLSHQAPLYGRATAALHLQPLPFGLTAQYFPAYSAAERVTAYAIFGGIPQYWRLLDPSKPLAKNIQETLLSPGNLMEGEARLLLQDFISDPHNYIAILRAIAYGRTTPKDIEGFTGISNVHLSQYLRNLIETGYVARRLPVTERQPSRAGRYAILDPYLRFYFRFLASRKTQFALGEIAQAYREMQRHLVDFIGAHTWEELCQEWLLRAAGRDLLPVFPDQVGSAWNKAAQVDVVGVNFMEKHIVLGECKWADTRQPAAVLRELVERKTAVILPSQGTWQVYYLGFARRGWTESAQQYAAGLEGEKPHGASWQFAGLRLLDLPQVDADLQAWS